MREYVHMVYGTGSALVRDPDGTVREATAAELEKLCEMYEPHLAESFTAERQ